MKVEFFKHSLGEDERKAILAVLETPFLTTGPKTQEFEKKLALYMGGAGALGMTSCTTALFLVLKALEVGPGDEVILPPMTFISSANVVMHCGAKPVFVDVEQNTGNMDVSLIPNAITKKTKVIMPVHLYGQMADMKRLRALADAHKLKILEDSAHSLEGMRDGIRPGQLGDAACFSFYATKNMTCGEGGAVVSNDVALLEKLLLLRLHGMDKSAADRYTKLYQHWDMTCLGYKANLPDILATLLIPQLEKCEARLQRREAICRYYEERFKKAGIEYPVVLPGVKSARHLFTVWVPKENRDGVLRYLQQKEIGVAVNFRAIHLLSYFRNTFGYKEGAFPVAEDIGARTLSIPLYPHLTDIEVEYVAETLIKAVREV